MATSFDIGGNVRRLREARGISLSALARQAGVSKAYLSQMENNPQKRPSVEIVHQLAQALEVRLTELIGLEEPEPTPEAAAAGGAASHTAASDAADTDVAADPGDLPPGLRIFWTEHPELPLEDIRLLAAVAQRISDAALSPTDYWLLHQTIRLIRRRLPRPETDPAA